MNENQARQSDVFESKSFFFDRVETSTKIVYRFKNQWINYLALALTFVAVWMLEDMGAVGLILGVYFIVYTVLHLKPYKEIRNAKKHGYVKTSGSRYSLSDPPVVEIEKEPK